MRTLQVLAFITAMCVVLNVGCRMSECVFDESAGMNGGFEVTKSGLPVNWLLYKPHTTPTGDFDLMIDSREFHSGKQSLKFVVHQCSSAGGCHAGLSEEYAATPGTTYTVGFWVKNDGAAFRARVGGVTANKGQYKTIVRSAETITTWRHYEHVYKMPAGFKRIRFELVVSRPGTFWLDDVTISGIKGPPAGC